MLRLMARLRCIPFVISLFLFLPACSPVTTYHGAKVNKDMLACCQSGNDSDCEKWRGGPQWSCSMVGEDVVRTDSAEGLRLLKRACELNSQTGCRRYVDRAGISSTELPEQLALGERLCREGIYEEGINKSAWYCVRIAYHYREREPKQKQKAEALLEIGCRTHHHEESCILFAKARGDSRLFTNEVDALKKQQDADRSTREQNSQQWEAERRAESISKQQDREAFNQALQQLNQTAQNMGGQPSSGFNAPAMGGGMVGEGSPGGACGSSCLNVECGALKQACQQGGQAACYRAAACVCRCHLNKGCSGSQAQLQQCVQENEANAQRLNSSTPLYSPGSTAPVAPRIPSPPPSGGGKRDNCPTGQYCASSAE